MSRSYEYRMVAILCAAFGVLSVEIFNVGYLAPFIARGLALTHAEIGLLLSAFWITYALGSYLAGVATDAWGHRKALLVTCLLLVSCCSVLSGIARSFHELLAARLLMGLLVGPFLPVAQTVIAIEVPGQRLGLYTGLLQSLGNNILAVFLAPAALVYLAVHDGWRVSFCAVLPAGLLCAALLAGLVREPGPRCAVRRNAPARGMAGLLWNRNFLACTAGAALLLGYITITMGFLPLLLVQGRALSPERMSGLISALGIAGAVLGVSLPAISDRIGRRPVMVAASALGIVGPAAALFYSGPIAVCAGLLSLGWAAAGVCPLFIAIVPSESVPRDQIATAVGLSVALATLAGGVAGPALAGWAADAWGSEAPLIICLACATAAALLGLLVRETAPRKTSGAAVIYRSASPHC